jgi:predicted transcriptional regulator
MANRKKARPMKRVTVTVDPSDYETIDRIARLSDVSASWLIRRSMREFLERHRETGIVELQLEQEAH